MRPTQVAYDFTDKPFPGSAVGTLPRAVPPHDRLSVNYFKRMTEAGILSSIDRLELIDLPPIGALHSAIVDCLVRHFGRSVDESVVVRCQNPTGSTIQAIRSLTSPSSASGPMAPCWPIPARRMSL